MLKEVILSIKLVMLIVITLQHSNTATQPHSNAAKQQESKTPKPSTSIVDNESRENWRARRGAPQSPPDLARPNQSTTSSRLSQTGTSWWFDLARISPRSGRTPT